MKYFAVYFLFLFRLVTLRSPISALCANQRIYMSGLLQIRKTEQLDELDTAGGIQAAPYQLLPESSTPESIGTAHRNLGGVWPVVVKPNIGERGLGVFVAKNQQELEQAANAQIDEYLLQTFVEGEEFGVFIVLPVGQKKPIIYIGRKIAPFVIGNGSDNLGDLITAKIPKHKSYLHKRNRQRTNTIPKNGEMVILDDILHGFRGTTQQVIQRDVADTELFNQICEYCIKFDYRYGRFDYRATNLEGLLNGEGKILEVNGLASLPPHLTVQGIKLIEQWKIMYQAWSYAYAIGDANIASGCQAYSFLELVKVSLKHLAYRIRFVLRYRFSNRG